MDRDFRGGLGDGKVELLLVHFRLLVTPGSVLTGSVTGAIKSGLKLKPDNRTIFTGEYNVLRVETETVKLPLAVNVITMREGG